MTASARPSYAGPEAGLSRWRAMVYALPTLPTSVVLFPAYAILPTFYARHTRIPLAVIGGILVASRILDAVIDPAIGYLSDNTRSPWGPRKPWLVAGGLVSMAAVWRLYAPAPDVGPLYYAGWLMLFYLGFTLIEIPHKAWGTDIVRGYVDRAVVSTWLGVAFAVGNLAFAALPFLPGFAGKGYDAATLRAVAMLVILALPLAIGAALSLAPTGRLVAAPRVPLARVLRSAAANRPFRQFLAIFLLAGFGQGIFYSLVFMFVGSVEGMGARFPILLLADALATFAALPLWLALIPRLEKHRAWAAGMLTSGLAVAALAAVPAGAAGFPALAALITLRALGGAVIYLAPHALLGDVVDYDLMKSGRNSAGNYNALVALVTKANGAVGGGLGLILIGLIGFSARGANTPATIWRFKLVVLLLPALLLAASAAAAWWFPLDRRRHDIVRRRLSSPARRRASNIHPG